MPVTKLCEVIPRQHVEKGGAPGGDEKFSTLAVYAAGRKLKEDGEIVFRAEHYHRNFLEGYTGYPYKGLPFSSEALRWLIKEYLQARPDEWVARGRLITDISARHIGAGGLEGILDPYDGSSHVLLKLKRAGSIISKQGSYMWPSTRSVETGCSNRVDVCLPDQPANVAAYSREAVQMVEQYLKEDFPQWKTRHELLKYVKRFYLDNGAVPVPAAVQQKTMASVLLYLEKKNIIEWERHGRGTGRWRHVPAEREVQPESSGNECPETVKSSKGFAGTNTPSGRSRKISFGTQLKLGNVSDRRENTLKTMANLRGIKSTQSLFSVPPPISTAGCNDREDRPEVEADNVSPLPRIENKPIVTSQNARADYEKAAEKLIVQHLRDVFPQWRTRLELLNYADRLYLAGGGNPLPVTERTIAVAAILFRLEEKKAAVILRTAKGERRWRLVPPPSDAKQGFATSVSTSVLPGGTTVATGKDFEGYGLPATASLLLPLVEDCLRAKAPGWLRRREIVDVVMRQYLKCGGLPAETAGGPSDTVKSALNKLKKAEKVEHRYPWVRLIGDGSVERSNNVAAEKRHDDQGLAPSAKRRDAYDGKSLPPTADMLLPLVENCLRAKAPGWLRRREIVDIVMAEHLKQGGLPPETSGGEVWPVKKVLSALHSAGKIEHKFQRIRWIAENGTGQKEGASGNACENHNSLPVGSPKIPIKDYPGEGLPATSGLLLPLVEDCLRAKAPGWLRRREIVDIVMAEHLKQGGLPPETIAGPDGTVKSSLWMLKRSGKIEQKYPWTRWIADSAPVVNDKTDAGKSPDFPSAVPGSGEANDYDGKGLPPTPNMVLPLVEEYLLSIAPGWTRRPMIADAVLSRHLALGGNKRWPGSLESRIKKALAKLKKAGKIEHKYPWVRAKQVNVGVENDSNPLNNVSAPLIINFIPAPEPNNTEAACSVPPSQKLNAGADRKPLIFGEGNGAIYAFHNRLDREDYFRRNPGSLDYPIKIGKTDSRDWQQRINQQKGTQRENPVVDLVFHTSNSKEWEALLHKALKLQEKHLPSNGAGGVEWFLTNPQHIKAIIDRNQPGA